jgi:adenylate kinase family enzyme
VTIDDVERVLVVGNGGAGKTWMADRLGERLGLPVTHLDRPYWRAGWEPTPREEWVALQPALVAPDRSIIDGDYSSTLDLRLPRADTVVFLDLPRLVCIWAVLRRWWRYRGHWRPDMAEGVNEKIDPTFLRWVWNHPRDRRPRILAHLATAPAGTDIVRLTSRHAARVWLERIAPGTRAGTRTAP